MLAMALCIFVSCAPLPPATPPQPSTPPPIPPRREANIATVTGQVRNARGNPVGRAQVLLTLADDGCRSLGTYVAMPADDNGEFVVSIEGGTGPSYSRCVLVEARSGGASGRQALTAHFSSSSDAAPQRTVITLDERTPLQKNDARRLVDLLSDAINNPAGVAAGELTLFVEGGDDAVRVAVEQYRHLLGAPTHVARIGEELNDDARYPIRRFSFELRGATGRSATIHVHQEELTRLHGLLLDYGMRSEAFVMAYIRAIASGDAMRLAQILNPDDVDFPVERAREMIVAYRLEYDTATLRPEFVSADDRRGTITYRIFGRTPSGGEASELIELMTGDGLIGVSNL